MGLFEGLQNLFRGISKVGRMIRTRSLSFRPSGWMNRMVRCASLSRMARCRWI